MHKLKGLIALGLLALIGGCASNAPPMDYEAFRQADPHSILVLPPLNNTPEVIAPYGVMAQLSRPIAEAGFYVFPVALVDQTFKANGITDGFEAQSIATGRLNEIFGADAALYVTIEEYGTTYVVISSETSVTVSARLVDLRSGLQLWEGRASASSAENQNNDHGIIGALVGAAINQIYETVTDRGFDIAAIASARLVSTSRDNGLLHGPRSRDYGEAATGERN